MLYNWNWLAKKDWQCIPQIVGTKLDMSFIQFHTKRIDDFYGSLSPFLLPPCIYSYAYKSKDQKCTDSCQSGDQTCIQ